MQHFLNRMPRCLNRIPRCLNRIPRCLAWMTTILLAAASTLSTAQTFPQRPVKIIVPFTPGGGPDIAARMMGRHLSDLWGQPVLVDNRAGARTLIGTEAAARSPADGYTLLMMTNEVLANTGLGNASPVVMQRDLAPVILVQAGVNVIAVRPDSPIKSVKDLLALARANPEKFSYGTPGVGSSSHMTAEQLMMMSGIKLTHVPYKGTAQSITDGAAGVISLVFAAAQPLMPLFQSGKLRPVAVGSMKRFPTLPDVPTLDESGLTGFDMSTFNGLLAPRATPAALIAKINKDSEAVLARKDVSDIMINSGALPMGGSPEDMGRFLDKRADVLKKLITFANISFH